MASMRGFVINTLTAAPKSPKRAELASCNTLGTSDNFRSRQYLQLEYLQAVQRGFGSYSIVTKRHK